MNFETDYIKTLAKILSDNDLTEISLGSGEESIVIKRDKESSHVVTEVMPISQCVQPLPQQPIQPLPQQPIQPVAQQAPVAVEEPTPETPKGTPIVSPMVGTFYAAPSSEDPPFVNVGDTITKGQVVCIVEAMKLMNKIESDVAGRIVKICVENGKPVEYGQVLMYVE